MILLERLTTAHIQAITLQPAQACVQGVLTAEFARDLTQHKGVGWAAVRDGRVIAAAGIVEMWEHRATAWALFSQDAIDGFIQIHRAVRDVLADAPWRRVEMTVDAQHDAGVRWAERLGFQCEGRMRAYTADGRDCFLFAKVK